MLINLSNHPYTKWDTRQKNAAAQFGKCADLDFPAIDPEGDERYICNLAETYRHRIHSLATQSEEETVVHLMGEMTFVFSLLQMLQQDDIRCLASTSQRISKEMGYGQKETQFIFVKFRNYFLVER